MTKSRSFSIYLLKPGYDATNALRDDHSLDDAIDADALPPGSKLYVLDNDPREPWWKRYFGVKMNLDQVTKGALIFVPVNNRCFALSFGHVFHNLNDESYEYNFGLRVTLNSLDPTKLKSTDVLEPGSARRQRTQVAVDSDLTYFDFDRDSTILKSLTGKVKTEHQDLFKHATGGSSLRISSSVSSEGITQLCEKLLQLYESDDYRTVFPDIQNITPIRDPLIINQLNEQLLRSFRHKEDHLYLTIPDIIDYRDNDWALFSGEGRSDLYDEVFLDNYYKYLQKNKKPINDVGISDLKKHRLKLVDENGNDRKSYQIFRCIVFDTHLLEKTETYHLNDGNWYCVKADYVETLRKYLDPLCIDFQFPDYTHASEGEYNKAVAATDPTIICLDLSNISPAGSSQIEPCDLYGVSEEFAVFTHVKISTLSYQLSHLFNQGVNAIELLKLDNDAIEKLNALISDKVPALEVEGFLKPIAKRKFHVVYGIVTHKSKDNKSNNFPLFSRISLMRTAKTLKLFEVKLNYGFILDDSPKKEPKKKPRKKKEA